MTDRTQQSAAASTEAGYVVHHTVEFDTTDEDKARKLIAYAKRIGVEHYLRDHHEVEADRG